MGSSGRAHDLPVETLLACQAPMVGISDLPFRLLCARWGATLTYTAMLHTTALVDDRDFREHVLRDLEFGCSVPGTPPVVAQLAGNDAQRLVEGGKVVAGSVDALELNIGCPQQRAKDGHYGAYLLLKKDLPLVCSLVQALTTLPLPIHTKYRLPPQPLTAADYAGHLAAAGSRTITLHARPAGSPSRRRDLGGLRVGAVGEVRRGLDEQGWGDVRVVGNGGVQVLADVERLRMQEGVQGWMVGEELTSNFRFFDPSHPAPRALALAQEYLDLVDLYPALVPLQTIQRHLRSFVEGDRLSAHSRERKGFLAGLGATSDVDAVRRLCEREEIVEAWGTRGDT